MPSMPSLLHRIAHRLGFVPQAEVQQAQTEGQIQGAARVSASAGAQQRSLLAAMTGHDTASWQADGLHINASTEYGLSVARARSRDAAMNNPWGRRFVGMVRRNILGPRGVRYQARVRFGSSGLLRTATNDALESAWDAWGRRGVCDITGRYTWRDIQRLALRHLTVDGEYFVRLLPGRGPHAFQLQLLPPEMIPLNTRADLTGGRKVRQGIEVDSEGRVLAYYIHSEDPATSTMGVFEATATPRGLKRIPAEEILHGFIPEQAGQLRGVPWMAAGLKSLYQAADFASSGLNKARESAKRGGWLQEDPDNAAPPNVSGVDQLTDGKDSSGVPFQTLHDGTWEKLPPGYTAQSFESDYPNIEYGQFIKDCLRNVASAFEVAYITLGNDLEAVNYSSGQLGLEDERTLWREMQVWFSEDHFCAPIHAAWMKHALIAAPEMQGLSYDRMAQYLAASTWQCHRWRPLDPLKHIEAQRSGIEGRLTSPQREIVANGEDPDEILAELLEWAEKTKGLPSAKPATPAKPAEPEADDTEDEAERRRALRLRLIATRSDQ